jgi:hypothetical protein
MRDGCSAHHPGPYFTPGGRSAARRQPRLPSHPASTFPTPPHPSHPNSPLASALSHLIPPLPLPAPPSDPQPAQKGQGDRGALRPRPGLPQSGAARQAHPPRRAGGGHRTARGPARRPLAARERTRARARARARASDRERAKATECESERSREMEPPAALTPARGRISVGGPGFCTRQGPGPPRAGLFLVPIFPNRHGRALGRSSVPRYGRTGPVSQRAGPGRSPILPPARLRLRPWRWSRRVRTYAMRPCGAHVRDEAVRCARAR